MPLSFNRPLSLRREILATTILLLIQIGLALGSVRTEGVTADESGHLAAGYAYWQYDDYRFQPENGNLPQRWGALPLLVTQPRLDPADHLDWWRESDVWRVAHAFLFDSGNPTDRMLWLARCAMMAWAVALALLVQGWARRLWGPGGGLLALALCALSPTVLAHGPLVTSDMTATVCLLAATAGWWWNCQRVTTTRLAVGGLLTGLAAIAKFSAVLLVPVFAALALWRVWSGGGLALTGGGRTFTINSRPGRFGILLASGILHGVIALGVIWTAFGWRYTGMNPTVEPTGWYYKSHDLELARNDHVGAAVSWAQTHHLLPEAYLQGFVFLRAHAEARAAFLAGDYRDTGWWWFFPAAFGWKSTEGELLAAVLVLALAVMALRRRTHMADRRLRLDQSVPLLAFGLVYGITSLATPLNIGQRHILPLYPVLFIFAGGLWHQLRSPLGRSLALAPVVLSAAAALTIFPHPLTYFNQLSGGPANGWRKLVDSSLDWGQGLPALAAWLPAHRQPGETVYLSYFGSNDPDHQGIDAIPLAPIYQNYEPRRFEELGPGLYCVGATMLQDVYSIARGDWTMENELAYIRGMAWARSNLAAGTIENRIVDFGREETGGLWHVDRLRFARLAQYLRVRPPDAVVANSILVYRLSEREVQTMVDGSLPSIADLMAEAADLAD